MFESGNWNMTVEASCLIVEVEDQLPKVSWDSQNLYFLRERLENPWCHLSSFGHRDIITHEQQLLAELPLSSFHLLSQIALASFKLLPKLGFVHNCFYDVVGVVLRYVVVAQHFNPAAPSHRSWIAQGGESAFHLHPTCRKHFLIWVLP